MTDFDPAQIESGIEAAAGIDWAGALNAVKTANVSGMLKTGEQLADLLSPFVPQAMYAKDVLEVAGFLVDMQNAGYIRAAQPEDAVMQRAAGHEGLGRDRT